MATAVEVAVLGVDAEEQTLRVALPDGTEGVIEVSQSAALVVAIGMSRGLPAILEVCAGCYEMTARCICAIDDALDARMEGRR